MKKILKTGCFLLTLVMLVCCLPAGLTTAQASVYNWAGAWGSPAIESGVTLGSDSVFEENGIHLRDYIPANSTIRTTVTPTLSGTKLRLKFSNLFGKESITINESTVAKTGKTDDMVLTDTITQVTFNGGQTSVTISAGSEVYSDEISFNVTALEKISVSSYFKKSTPMYTVGLYGGTAYLATSLGNRTHKDSMTAVASKLNFTSNSITYNTLPFLTRVDVYAEDAYCVVLLGDSTLTNDMYLLLAQKLHANGIHNIGVVMSGIIGNRLLYNGAGLLGKVYGQALLTRANRDAFDVAGVRYIIVKIGENDVLHPMENSMKGIAPYASTSEIIAGYKKLADMNQFSGVNMYLCTRTPYKGYTRNFMGDDDLVWTQKGENMLLELNSWVKYLSHEYYSGYINLDAMRDPNDSAKLRSQMTTDGIHFSRLGQIAAVDLIPEEAYGVNRDLKNLSAILGTDPYTATSSSSGGSSSNQSGSGNSALSGVEDAINGAIGGIIGGSSSGGSQNGGSSSSGGSSSQPQTETPQTPQTDAPAAGTATTEATTLSNANQIMMNDPANSGSVTPAGAVQDDASASSASRQIAGFAILAAVAVAVISIAAVLLIKMRPASSAPLTRGSYGRARQKHRV